MKYRYSWNKYFQKVGDCGISTYIGHRKQNDVRISAAAQKCSSNYRKRPQQLRQQRKRTGLDTASYQSGAFSTKKQPDISNETNAEEKITKSLFIDETKVKLLKINFVFRMSNAFLTSLIKGTWFYLWLYLIKMYIFLSIFVDV